MKSLKININMKKQVLSIIVVLLFSMAAIGQSRHEISVFGAGGLSTLDYKLSAGDKKLGFGGSAGLGYNYFFSEHWGLGTGVEIAFYNSKTKFNDYLTTRNAVDVDGQAYESRYRLNDFEEKQNAMFINIPLMVQYQTGSKHQFYAALGAKLGIPVSTKFKTNESNILSSGYYSEEMAEYTTQEFLGFGTLNGNKVEDDFDLKLACLISVEAGVKWKLKDHLYLYTGAYFDYGVNNLAKDQDKEFIVRDGLARNYTTNSVLQSTYKSEVMADKIHPMAVGLKVRLSFGLKDIQKDYVIVGEVVEVTTRPARVSNADRQRQEEEAKRRADAEKQRQAEEAKKRADAAAYQAALTEMATVIDGFEVGSEDLNATRRAILDKKVEIMKQYPDMRVTLVGNTCDIDTDYVNMREGLLRSEAAKNYMVSKGIAASRIDVTSKGLTNPVVANTSEANRKLNRRVEFVVNK